MQTLENDSAVVAIPTNAVAVDEATDPTLFCSTSAALAFAFNFKNRASDKPSALARLMAGPVPTGRGLGGLDGAAQAGMIRCEVAALQPRIRGHILAARFTVRELPCPCRHACCSGMRPNAEWRLAVSEIAEAVRTEALAGTVVNYTLRNTIVARYFGVHRNLVDVAKAAEVHRDTASSHANRICTYLKDAERQARYAIEERLKAAGIVE